MVRPLIILVHGCWHWGGCFSKLAARLALQGYPVAAPDLAGHGHDTTSLEAIRDMSQYTQPAERMLAASDRPVVLLGHSLGGATLSYLGERHSQRIAGLVFLAAVMPRRGISVSEYGLKPTAESQAMIELTADGLGLALKPDREGLRRMLYQDCAEKDVDIAAANVSRVNSLVPITWKSEITAERFGRIPRAYIETLVDRALSIESQRRYQQDVPGATVFTIDSGHSPFFSHPEKLAGLLHRFIEDHQP